MDRKKLFKIEKKLLKGLETKANNDGYYEQVLNEYTQNSNFSINRLSMQFPDSNFSELLVNCYFEFIETLSIATFMREIQKLVQTSIQNKVLSGKASYLFIKHTASIAQESWIKAELETPNASKKLKVLYFFKKFEKMFLDVESAKPTKTSKTKLLNEYNKYAVKKQKYIDILLSNTENAYIDEDLIFNALKKSF